MGKKSITALALNHYSDKALELTPFWVPPVPPWEPLKKTLNSSLRMACVVEDRLYQGLRFEGEIMLLTPGNWKQVLRHGRPDFLLMESIWSTALGHWHMGQCPSAPGREELLEVVSLASKLSIPTVFWMTKGHEYHAHYKDFARWFAYVFCADPKEAELLRAEGVKAEVLLPCVQPALYNPFRDYAHYEAFSLDMLYDGWADLDRMPEDLNILQEVKPYGLNIIESRYQIFRRRLHVLPEYRECILGCTTRQSRIQALRYAKAYVSLDQTLSTTTTQQWMALEAAASRVPVVHHGTLPAGDVRKDVVIECPEQTEFLVEFVRFREDAMYRSRVAHLGWRKTLQEHTFAHRLQKICTTLGLDHDWEQFPKATLITPTFRRELLPRCLKTYERQTYPHKELVVVYNGCGLPSFTELGLEGSRDDVKIGHVPGEMFAGACMNYGHILADGEYCFRVDDDDHYGENYILDMILFARSLDVDLLGKPPAPFSFEESPTVYSRNTMPELCIINQEMLSNGKLWFGGNSIGGRRRLFLECMYDDIAYGAADTSFVHRLSTQKGRKTRYALMDGLNLVAMRISGGHNHTWKVDEKMINDTCSQCCAIHDFFV